MKRSFLLVFSFLFLSSNTFISAQSSCINLAKSSLLNLTIYITQKFHEKNLKILKQKKEKTVEAISRLEKELLTLRKELNQLKADILEVNILKDEVSQKLEKIKKKRLMLVQASKKIINGYQQRLERIKYLSELLEEQRDRRWDAWWKYSQLKKDDYLQHKILPLLYKISDANYQTKILKEKIRFHKRLALNNKKMILEKQTALDALQQEYYFYKRKLKEINKQWKVIHKRIVALNKRIKRLEVQKTEKSKNLLNLNRKIDSVEETLKKK
jgi:hypothetical protein